MTTKDTRIHEGGVNVFADLGLPDADNHFLKAQIVAECIASPANASSCSKRLGRGWAFPSPKYHGCSRVTSANTRLTV